MKCAHILIHLGHVNDTCKCLKYSNEHHWTFSTWSCPSPPHRELMYLCFTHNFFSYTGVPSVPEMLLTLLFLFFQQLFVIRGNYFRNTQLVLMPLPWGNTHFPFSVAVRIMYFTVYDMHPQCWPKLSGDRSFVLIFNSIYLFVFRNKTDYHIPGYHFA